MTSSTNVESDEEPDREPDGEPDGESAQLQAWIERVGTWCMEQVGWPPIMGRTLAWLMVCEPQEQTAAQISTAIQASRASLTGTLRLLTEARMIQAVTHSGDRSRYYQLIPGAWTGLLQRRLESVATFLNIARDGVSLFPEGAPQAERVREAQNVFEWISLEASPLLKAWEASQNKQHSNDSGDTPSVE